MGLLVAPPKRAMDEVVVPWLLQKIVGFLDEDIAITNGSEKVINLFGIFSNGLEKVPNLLGIFPKLRKLSRFIQMFSEQFRNVK